MSRFISLEQPKIHAPHEPTPRRVKGPHQQLVATMDLGDWVLVSHARAKALAAAARSLGGRATQYRVDDASSCVRVIDAPWKKAP